MEELKILIELVKDLPSMAIIVLAMYFLFKLAVIGSIYGVIKFTVDKLHGWAVKKKDADVTLKQTNYTLDGSFITKSVDDRVNPLFTELIRTIKRDESPYIHQSDLELAIKKLKKEK